MSIYELRNVDLNDDDDVIGGDGDGDDSGVIGGSTSGSPTRSARGRIAKGSTVNDILDKAIGKKTGNNNGSDLSNSLARITQQSQSFHSRRKRLVCLCITLVVVATVAALLIVMMSHQSDPKNSGNKSTTGETSTKPTSPTSPTPTPTPVVTTQPTPTTTTTTTTTTPTPVTSTTPTTPPRPPPTTTTPPSQEPMENFSRAIFMPATSFATTTAGGGGGVPPTTLSPEEEQHAIPSKNDKRQYESFFLHDNGLQVFLVSDPDASKSAAATSVGVGHFGDPDDYPGLAHFLEHMLFMGTKKYPQEDGYTAYLSAHGGSDNAYTSEEHTVFFFSVDNTAYEGAVDRFSRFFIDPLLKESAVAREMNAVNSEHLKNLQNDGWRDYQLEKDLSNPQHPWHKFSTGSLETLQKPGVRDALLAFHHRHYHSLNMRVCLYSRESLTTMHTWAVKYFSEIPASDGYNVNDAAGVAATTLNRRYVELQWSPPATSVVLTPSSASPQPYPEQYLHKAIYLVPITDRHVIRLKFIMPAYQRYYRISPSTILSYVLGHEGAGSVTAWLKSQHLGHSISAGFDHNGSSFSIFGISATLTMKGMLRADEIIGAIFENIRMLQSLVMDLPTTTTTTPTPTTTTTVSDDGQHEDGWRQLYDYWEDEMISANMAYRFQERGDVQDTTSAHARDMLTTEVSDLLGSTHNFRFDRSILLDALSRLTVDNCNVWYISHLFRLPKPTTTLPPPSSTSAPSPTSTSTSTSTSATAGPSAGEDDDEGTDDENSSSKPSMPTMTHYTSSVTLERQTLAMSMRETWYKAVYQTTSLSQHLRRVWSGDYATIRLMNPELWSNNTIPGTSQFHFATTSHMQGKSYLQLPTRNPYFPETLVLLASPPSPPSSTSTSTSSSTSTSTSTSTPATSSTSPDFTARALSPQRLPLPTTPSTTTTVDTDDDADVIDNSVLWYHRDWRFRVPKNQFHCVLDTPVIHESLASVLYMNVMIQCHEDALHESAYSAGSAGLGAGISFGTRGMLFTSGGYGYTLEQQAYAERSMHAFSQRLPCISQQQYDAMSPERFATQQMGMRGDVNRFVNHAQGLRLRYMNEKFEKPYKYATYLEGRLMNHVRYSRADHIRLLGDAKRFNLEGLHAFARRLFPGNGVVATAPTTTASSSSSASSQTPTWSQRPRMRVECLMTGNATPQQTYSMFEALRRGFHQPRPLAFSAISTSAALPILIPPGEAWVYQAVGANEHESNSVLLQTYQLSGLGNVLENPSDPTTPMSLLTPPRTLPTSASLSNPPQHEYMMDYLHSRIMNEMMQELCFNQLRTREQLGYIVWCYTTTYATSHQHDRQFWEFKIIVQGPYNATYVDQRADAFVAEFLHTHLPQMTEGEFASIITSLSDKMTTPFQTSGEISSHLWSEIASHTYLFNRQTTEYLFLHRYITLASYRAFLHRSLSRRTRRKVAVEVYGTPKGKASGDLQHPYLPPVEPVSRDDVGERIAHLVQWRDSNQRRYFS